MAEGPPPPASRRRHQYSESELFRRADTFRHMLMEDFRFMEAARMHSGEYEGATLQTEDLKPRQKLKNLMNTNPNGLVNFASYIQRPPPVFDKNYKPNIEEDPRTRRFNTRMSDWPPICIWAHWLHNTRFFSIAMITVILMNALLITVDQELSQDNSKAQIRLLLEALDFFFLFMFVAEIMLKWCDDFKGFWGQGWNIFDFLITSVSLVAPILDILYPETDEEEENETIIQAVKYLRIVRILRTLNVVTRIAKIKMIWDAVMRTFVSMVFITSLMLIFFYIFAIIGIELFTRFTSSHKPGLVYRNAFANLPNAFVTLFQLFTLDHYADIIEETTSIGNEQWQYAVALLYNLVWLLLGAFIFNNIFAGVMVNTFQNIRSDNIQEDASINEKRRLAYQLNIFGTNEDEDSKEFEKMRRLRNGDPTIDWEHEIYHTLEVVNALGYGMSPTIWPRDTLFQYYMILESLASNIEERNNHFRLLDQAILKMFDC